MCHIFGPEGTDPIPADFFGPASDPFEGEVCLRGVPLGSGDYPQADTLIQRDSDPFDPTDPPSTTPSETAITIVALSLEGVAPITVTYNGGQNPELWEVDVTLSDRPQVPGSLRAIKSHCNGGTYTSILHVDPKFIFTRDTQTRIWGDDVDEHADVTLDQSTLVPWVHELPGDPVTVDPCSGFHVGVIDPDPSPTDLEVEDCSDGEDNDCDDLIDCADPDCAADPNCPCGTNEHCNDGNDCTLDTCNAGVCTHVAEPDGSPCDADGLFCTRDFCQSGVCDVTIGTPCPGPDYDGDCAESCDEDADNCLANDPDGSTCYDDLFCTQTDTCSGGQCIGAGNRCPGPDGDGDCAESCDEDADNCLANDPNESPCDADGLFCTDGDTCQDGSCNAGDNPCVSPANCCELNSGHFCSDDCSIPAVSSWGLAVMTLLVVAAGTVVIGRSRVAVR